MKYQTVIFAFCILWLFLLKFVYDIEFSQNPDIKTETVINNVLEHETQKANETKSEIENNGTATFRKTRIESNYLLVHDGIDGIVYIPDIVHYQKLPIIYLQDRPGYKFYFKATSQHSSMTIITNEEFESELVAELAKRLSRARFIDLLSDCLNFTHHT